MQSDCRLLWKVWLKTLNLALVGGTHHYFPCDLILFVYFVFFSFVLQVNFLPLKFGERSLMLCLTWVIPLVLYF
jgi:hypothetical protein